MLDHLVNDNDFLVYLYHDAGHGCFALELSRAEGHDAISARLASAGERELPFRAFRLPMYAADNFKALSKLYFVLL